jgi:hypothetical protein
MFISYAMPIDRAHIDRLKEWARISLECRANWIREVDCESSEFNGRAEIKFTTTWTTSRVLQ